MITEEYLLTFVEPHLHSHILRKFTKSGVPSTEVDARFFEMLKFLYLTSSYQSLRGTFIPVTQLIDDIWHEAILQTRSYDKLCKKLPGGEFIHHESMIYDHYMTRKPKSQQIKEILLWAELYVENFGDFRPERIQYWFFLKTVLKVADIDLTTLNFHAKKSNQLSAKTNNHDQPMAP